MSDYKELDMNELEQVSGGVTATTRGGRNPNTAIWKNWESIGVRRADDYLENDVVVNVVGSPKFHKDRGMNFVKIEYMKKSGMCTGWIAASALGLKC